MWCAELAARLAEEAKARARELERLEKERAAERDRLEKERAAERDRMEKEHQWLERQLRLSEAKRNENCVIL